MSDTEPPEHDVEAMNDSRDRGVGGDPTSPAPLPGTARNGGRQRARLLILALAVSLLLALVPFLPGLLGAVVLQVIFRPTYERLTPRIGGWLASVILSVAAVLLLLLPSVWMTMVLVEQSPGALARLLASDAFAWLSGLHLGPADIGVQLARAAEGMVGWVSRSALGIVGSATRAILNLFLAIVGLYYLLRSGSELWLQLRPLIPFSTAGAEELRMRFTSVTEATVLGIAATGLAQGTTVGLAFWMVGLPNPVVWGLATAIASVLPVLGSALVWGPGVVVLLTDGRPAAAVVLAAIGLIIASNVDNLIRPMVYSRYSDVHPMATLVGAFAGVKLMGLVGLLLGPLAISYLFELLRLYQQEYGEGAATVS